LNANELRPTALPTSSRGTSSGTQLCRAGASKDCVAACSPLINSTTTKLAVPVSRAAASSTAVSAVIRFVLSRMRRRG
jgi:hypothetical protein